MTRASALVVAPHPDDETFGCGGTVAALAASGVDVFVQVIAQHSINTGGPDTVILPAERGEELSRACKKLGVADHHVMYEKADYQSVLHSDLAN
ncbi:PIG-L deacetylase family protein [Antribacter gilvus]|uniref:PIG-L deacetylase family protein n=1 Tax=Antribacter gilvus TaxID=2304675 RepID=UPI000F7A5EF0|nr:PIG-L family deacetylase [Antribacter gilvus]